MRAVHSAAALTAVLLSSGGARADAWLVAEAPAAVAVSDAQEGVFRPGVMPAVGVYASNDRVALGLRVRAGILRNGPAPGDNVVDPGAGGLGTVGAAIRFGARGAWIEGVGGGGITGRDLVPAVELGAGWTFGVGAVELGPSVRYARVYSRDPMSAFGTAELVLAGVDVKLGVDRPRRPLRAAAAPPVRRVAAMPAPVREAERDRDALVDREASCAEALDGCPLSEDIVVRDSRIVLSERVLFDFDRVRVRSRGREAVAQIARLWKAHPEWRHLTVEGHADARGDDAYNQHLSEVRAQRVRDVLLANGCDPAAVDAVGLGRSRPRDSGGDEAAHRANRRVEFVIDQRIPLGAVK
ncbi:MAG: OmpA family protein [Deltaproteobacteria bacterium]|nr:OmpA family protein [Deltaproteobacteria bacterium]